MLCLNDVRVRTMNISTTFSSASARHQANQFFFRRRASHWKPIRLNPNQPEGNRKTTGGASAGCPGWPAKRRLRRCSHWGAERLKADSFRHNVFKFILSLIMNVSVIVSRYQVLSIKINVNYDVNVNNIIKPVMVKTLWRKLSAFSLSGPQCEHRLTGPK